MIVQVAVGTRELVLSLEFPSGEAGGEGGPSVADAMLAAQQTLVDNPEDESESGDDSLDTEVAEV